MRAELRIGDSRFVMNDVITWWIATRKEDLTPEEANQRAMELFKQMPQPTGS